MIAWINSFMSTPPRKHGKGRWGVGWRLSGALAVGFLLTLFAAVSSAGTLEGILSLSTEKGGKGEVFLGAGETVRAREKVAFRYQRMIEDQDRDPRAAGRPRFICRARVPSKRAG